MNLEIRRILWVLLIAVTPLFPCLADARDSEGTAWENLHIGGYVQAGYVHISASLPAPAEDESWNEYRVQKRLNIRWDPAPNIACHWQMRTRLFAGDRVRQFPAYAQEITEDYGLVDLSWTIIEEDNRILHYIPDRLYAEGDWQDWNIRVGRQRVNWGVNMITNPNDIFNIYSIYDFDYPERPGSDAIRIQRFMGFASRMEVAASPARNIEESVAAVLYAFDRRGYDIQLIAGYFRERAAAGAGWAGSMGGTGLKGEAMVFSDIKGQDNGRDTDFIIAAAVDHMFANSLFMVIEGLYNSGGGADDFLLRAQRLSPDNPSFSKYQVSAQFSYPFHPLLDGAITLIGYPDEDALFISPALTWSVAENLDARLVGQFFTGGGDSAIGSAGTLVSASLQYHF